MNPELLRLSEFTCQGRTLQKIDLLGTVAIDGTPFLTVYRRYNNVHEIIVVDCQGDIYLQPDLPLLESIQRVLCLSPIQTTHVRIAHLFSFQHQGPPPTGHPSPLDLYWSEIQNHWQGIAVDLVNVWEPASASASSATSPTTSTITLPTSHSSDEHLVHLLTDLQPSTENPVTSSDSKKRSWSQRTVDGSYQWKRKGKRKGEREECS